MRQHSIIPYSLTSRMRTDDGEHETFAIEPGADPEHLVDFIDETIIRAKNASTSSKGERQRGITFDATRGIFMVRMQLRNTTALEKCRSLVATISVPVWRLLTEPDDLGYQPEGNTAGESANPSPSHVADFVAAAIFAYENGAASQKVPCRRLRMRPARPSWVHASLADDATIRRLQRRARPVRRLKFPHYVYDHDAGAWRYDPAEASRRLYAARHEQKSKMRRRHSMGLHPS